MMKILFNVILMMWLGAAALVLVIGGFAKSLTIIALPFVTGLAVLYVIWPVLLLVAVIYGFIRFVIYICTPSTN